MFKLESYIAPILLSYVDKYIKNFKLEDSQVSLWGGDASFQNLDLRLEVLEEELQLPFHIVSGHIRELLIHVPWTKLTSEPITITINTIECILKLKTGESSTSPGSLKKKKEKRKKIAGQRLEIDAPPNYVQLLINKIVSNIRIYCNNVILKYVEEDIVLSMNVKLLKFESANEIWESAYTDLSSTQIILRKLIGINDLTICLDKRNAAGKIDFYQEPMLYRCSLTMHLLRYYSMNDNKNLITRLDVCCNNMEFSMTEQQVPMVLRLLKLLYALQQKQLKSDGNNYTNTSNLSNDDREVDEQTWAGWAWSYVAAVLPGENANEFEESIGQANLTLQIGFYIDNASITFKVSESNSERAGYYTQKKVRYWPLLTLQIQGLYSETISHGIKWLNSTFGISQLLLLPAGYCSCSHIEVLDHSTAVPYLKIGSLSSNHKTDSLFDAEAIENKGQSRNYNTNWDYHMNINSESVLLERTPAFVSDYVYSMEIPDDMSSEVLSELGSDLEFSDLSEKSSLRICVGPLKLRVCSGLFHRMDSLFVAASAYDYAPYTIPKPDALLNELLPPSAEDFDSLNKFIPFRTIQINFFAPVLELQLMDHKYFKAELGRLFRKHKKISNQLPQINDVPKIIFECQLIDLSFYNPMYVKRLVHTTCQLPDIPKPLFDACYSKQNLKIFGLSSSLIINSNNHTTIILPFNLSYENKSILKPQYWIRPDTPHQKILFESENVTINGTKAKMLIIYHIINNMLKVYNSEDIGNNYLTDTSLLSDASAKDNGMPYLEICLENLNFRKVTTNSTVSINLQLGSIKAFIFESVDSIKTKDNNYNIEQVLFLSGPEPNRNDQEQQTNEDIDNSNDIILFTSTIQFPLNPQLQTHPPIIILNLQEMKISIDPLLIKWLLYFPRIIKNSDTQIYYKSKSLSDTSGSNLETPRRSSAQIESVHSSSDKDLVQLPPKALKIPKDDDVDLQEKICNFLKNWADVWKGMLLCGDISQFTIFFPMVSLSAIGAQGIEETIQHSITSTNPADILVITLPSANLRSFQKENLMKYLVNLPVKLPDYLWTVDKSTFPWTLSLTDLTCFTIQNGIKEMFLKPITISATIALSTKNRNEILETATPTNLINDNKLLKYLGICIHIDMTPLIIKISQIQVYLFSSIINGLIDVITNLLPINNNKKNKSIKELPIKTSDQILSTIIKEYDSPPTLSPTLIPQHQQQQPDSTLDSLSEKLLMKTNKETDDSDDNDLKLTIWIQWTITKLTIELLTNNNKQKLVIDIEDIVSSLDFQLIYLKLKSKIGSITVQHYKRNSNKWESGQFSGIVMRLREDVLIDDRLLEDNCFISITITRASCQHTHTLWGANNPKKNVIRKDKKIQSENSNRYITEIVMNVQPVDFVLSLNTLKDFYLILKPFTISKRKDDRTVIDENKETTNGLINLLNNQILPLAYLDCRDIRLIIPSIELYENDLINQDVFIFQVSKISLSPSAVNPICRTPLRSDIYLQAAQARILNIPGSEIEDRQYQLDIIGISMNTTTWDDLNNILNNSTSTSILHGMSENPALEWNNLEQGQLSINPILNLTPITDKFDISIIVAPAMIYSTDIIICGNSMEINCVSDINFNLSLGQLKLISALVIEFENFSSLSSKLIDDNNQINILNIYNNKFSYTTSFDINSKIKLNEEVNESEFNELYKDSGIDTSEIRSTFSTTKSKILLGNNSSTSKQFINVYPVVNTTIIPTDILFTAGKINLSLYELKETSNLNSKKLNKLIKRKISLLKTVDCQELTGHDEEEGEERGYDASGEEGDDSIDNERLNDNLKNFLPLLFVSLSQPNLYLSKQYLVNRIQASCYDISVKLNMVTTSIIHRLPVETDFVTNLLETRSGIPNQTTGILPAFCTMKYMTNSGKSACLDLEISKPSRIYLSLNKWTSLNLIKNKLIENLICLQPDVKDYPKVQDQTDNYSSYQLIKEKLYGINTINLKFDQIVLVMKSFDDENGPEMNLSINKIQNHLTLLNRPEKLCNLATFDSITLSVTRKNDNLTKLILNPWTISVDLNLFWESWQNSKPQIRLTFESDCLILNLIPEQIRNLSEIIEEFNEFFFSNLQLKENSDFSPKLSSEDESNKEQYYKDDLRAGAFQFVDSNTNNIDEFPLPYQVMFWNRDFSAMVWRYPQPRALIKVRVFPVPYKLISIDSSHNDLQVLCELQYWSDCHNCYLPYTQFYLSENEVCHLNLPKGDPKPPVACIWRVLLTTINNTTNDQMKISISPRALAACMRIDSYFNRNLIPNLMIAFYLSKINLNLFTYFNKLEANYNLPDCLKEYSPDLMLPELQCFLTVTFENLQLFLTSWNLSMLSFDINFATKCTVLDYMFLIEQNFIENFSSKLELSVSNQLNCNFISKPIKMKFGPTIAHTLAVSGQLWSQSFDNTNQIKDFIILTRYVICNNTNVSLRFGQVNTDENILLASKCFHMYSWRMMNLPNKSQFSLRVAFEENDWLWSKPFKIDYVGVQFIQLRNKNDDSNCLTIIVKVVELSSTQKQIIISGQLVISNMLLEHFEFKLISEDFYNKKDNDFRKLPSHILGGKSKTTSMFINCKQKYFLRLRFFGLESAWTGDIPLQEHTKGTQPWLVKVPLQDKGNFLSIWCRIVVQDFDKEGQKILAMLWPLFMVKSCLPFSSNIHIETYNLNVRLDTTINGKGELQQLYCPGTIDHSHQLIFDDGISTSSPYIPLHYRLVDQQKFFKKNGKEDIDEILKVLNDFDKTKWPYFGDDLDNIEWGVEDQPLTTVQILYKNVCNYSSALLLELVPWCLMVNTLGCPISLSINGIELCRLNQHCIIAPPKLDENFNLGVYTGLKWNFSNPLQLAKSDWSQTFYMPRITGTIPLDGNIKINIKCELHISMVSITSSLVNEIRLLKISSTHVFSNFMSTQIQIVCFAVPDIVNLYDLPENFEEFSFTVAPRLDKSSSGISLIQWYLVDVNCSDSNIDYALYMVFSIKPELGWSCPVRVDKIFTRKNISVATDTGSIPMSLTAQEYKGQIYLSLHHDTRPQMLIDNKSDIIMYCAQSLNDFGNKIASECQHFKWYNKLNIGKCAYYTMPIISDKFPDLPQKNCLENIVFSCQPEDDAQDFQWSIPISIVTDTEYFVHIPYYGDIKLIIKSTAFTTLLIIHSVSYVQISARDIRVRLSMHEMQTINSQQFQQQQTYLQQQQKLQDINSSNIPKSFDTTLTDNNSNNDLSLIQNENEIELCSTSLNTFESNTTIANKKQSDLDIIAMKTSSPIKKLQLIPTIPLNKTNWKSIELFLLIKSFSIIFISDYNSLNLNECCEIANFTCDNIGLIINQQQEFLNLNLTISGVQFDNQLYSRESYDFPVVLIGQDNMKNSEQKLSILNIPIIDLLKNVRENALIRFDINLESYFDNNQNKSITGLKDVKIILNPLNCFIEDVYLTRLNNYLKILIPTNLILWPKTKKIINFNLNSVSVLIPDIILWQSKLLSKSLTIKNITVEPLSLLLSVHCSVKLYIALDQSSLVFGRFERKRLFTTPDRLGHALTMHYISGALFGAGWVVSSLELLGSPGGLARAMRIGLRDFISLPYRGLVQGPWAFLTGVTHGSASLMKHMTAGTVQSVTKLASSVARNLDRLTLDEEHLKRTEEQRRQKPQGLTQGFMQGLTGLGISLLGAVGGIAHHPLQSVMSDQASPVSLAKGVGLGLVGVFTKPLSGAAELVALTGQGLLQGAGWNPLPTPRASPESININSAVNSILKYNWKFLYTISRSDLLFVIEATSITNSTQYEAIALILTIDALMIIDLSKDCSQRIISLNELQIVDNNDNDPTLLSFKLISPVLPTTNNTTTLTTIVEDELRIEMDPACRARVADYVRNTVGLLQLPTGNNSTTTSHSEISISPLNSPNIQSDDDNINEEMAVLTYYVNPQFRNYFISLFNLAKQQKCNYNFPVLL